MANEFELSPESLAVLAEDFDQLAAEKAEAAQAQQAREDEALRVSRERLRVAGELEASNARISGESAELLSNMQSDIDRVDEINNSLMLRVIEPIAGIFNEDFSREKLAESLANDSQALQINNIRGSEEAKAAEARNKTLQAELDIANAKFAQETGDVSVLAEQIQTNITARNQLADMRENILVNASDEDLASGRLISLGISEKAIERQQGLNEDEILARQNKRISTQLNQIRFAKVQVEKATDAQLADPEFVKNHNPQFVREVKQARASRSLAFQQQRLATAQQVESEKLSAFSDKVLKAITAGEAEDANVQGPEAELELIRRQKLRAQTAQEKARADNQSASAALNAGKLLIHNSTISEKQNWLDNHNKDGIITVTDDDGTQIGLRAVDVRAELRLQEDSEATEAIELATQNNIASAMPGAIDEIYRASGLPVVEGVSVVDQLQTLMDSGDLSSDQAGELAAAQSKFDAATNGVVGSAVTRNKMMEQAAVTVKKVRDSVVQTQIAGKPPALQAAFTRFVAQKGKVKQANDAVNLVTISAASDIHTNSPAYNQSIQILRNSATKTVSSNATEDEKASALAEQFAIKERSQTDIIASKTLDQAVQSQMALPVVSEMAMSAYSEAARQLGADVLALQIQNGGLFANGSIDERVIVEVINANAENLGFDAANYLEKLREVVPGIAKEVTRADGDLDAQAAVASINKLLFNNNVVGYAQNYITDRFRAATNTQARADARASRIAGPGATFLPGGQIDQTGL